MSTTHAQEYEFKAIEKKENGEYWFSRAGGFTADLLLGDDFLRDLVQLRKLASASSKKVIFDTVSHGKIEIDDNETPVKLACKCVANEIVFLCEKVKSGIIAVVDKHRVGEEIDILSFPAMAQKHEEKFAQFLAEDRIGKRTGVVTAK